MFSKNNPSQTLWVGLSFLALGLMGGFLLSGGSENSLTNLFQAAQNPEEDSSTPQPSVDVGSLEDVVVSTDDDAVLGDPDAPVTMVVFSDFQCPYCQQFYKNSFGLIKENYIDTGKVRFIYRDFPLSAHPQANLVAQAAECVRSETDGEGYYAFHDWLFENTSLWSGQDAAQDILTSVAQEEFDVNIKSCLDKGTFSDEVAADLAAGRSYGVSGTPTIFINGKKLVGAWPYSVFEEVIESQL